MSRYSPDQIITPMLAPAATVRSRSLSGTEGLAMPRSRGMLSFLSDGGQSLQADELANQFILFQLSREEDDADGMPVPALRESSEIDPMFAGSFDTPDIYLTMSLDAFHLADNEEVDEDTRASIRLTVNADPASGLMRNLDILFWAIAAGIDLHQYNQGTTDQLRNFSAEFQRAFSNRPIAIAGGLANFSFEVIKHNEPTWWQKIFQFLQTRAGKSLISVIGLPGVTSEAVGLVEELFDRLYDTNAKVLFKGRPMRLALTELARDQYTAGNLRVRIGSLNPGFAVLARGADFQTFVDAKAYYYPTYGKLVPHDVSPAQLVSGQYDDPFCNLTYAVLRIGMSETSIAPQFVFGNPTGMLS